MRVLMLVSALRSNEPKWIAVTLRDVLDGAGEGAPRWARIESAWRGVRSVDSKKGKGEEPVRDILAYLRAYVGDDARSRALRDGEEPSRGPVQIAHMERTGAAALDRLPSPDHDVLLTWEEEQARLKRFEVEVAKLLRPEDRQLLDLMESCDLSAAEAERRLGTSGAWRNLVKRLRRKHSNPAT
jgi:hypothetical protein